MADPATVDVAGRARRDNAEHLAPAFLTQIVARYDGTRLGRQELDAELIEERDRRAVAARATIEACRVAAAPELRRIVVAVDPPASSGEGSDACGIVAAGIGADGIGYVLRGRDGGAAVAGALGEARGRPLSTGWRPTASWRR